MQEKMINVKWGEISIEVHISEDYVRDLFNEFSDPKLPFSTFRNTRVLADHLGDPYDKALFNAFASLLETLRKNDPYELCDSISESFRTLQDCLLSKVSKTLGHDAYKLAYKMLKGTD